MRIKERHIWIPIVVILTPHIAVWQSLPPQDTTTRVTLLPLLLPTLLRTMSIISMELPGIVLRPVTIAVVRGLCATIIDLSLAMLSGISSGRIPTRC